MVSKIRGFVLFNIVNCKLNLLDRGNVDLSTKLDRIYQVKTVKSDLSLEKL